MTIRIEALSARKAVDALRSLSNYVEAVRDMGGLGEEYVRGRMWRIDRETANWRTKLRSRDVRCYTLLKQKDRPR